MKISKQKQLGYIAGAVSFAFSLAPFAYAAVISGEGEAEVRAINISQQGSGGVEDGIQVGLGATITPVKGVRIENEVNTAGGVKMEDGTLEISTRSTTSGKDTGPDHATGTLRAEGEADAHADAGLDNAILHIDLGGKSASGAQGETEVSEATNVHSTNDLESFVAFKAKSDDRIKAVDVKNGTVAVDYDEDAKLFGFLNTKVTAHTTTDAAGNVTVTYPWYHIFMKKQHSSASLQSELARAVAAEKKGEQEGMASTTIKGQINTTNAIPNLFETIVNTLKGASVHANVSAQGNVLAQ